MDWREEIVIEYIIANPDCTRTSVKDGCIKYIGEATTDKILKKLIDEDKVFFYVDKVNTRIHHLYVINSPFRSIFQSQMKMKNLLVSKVEEQIEKQNYTTAQLEGGVWISSPVHLQMTNPNIRETRIR